MKIEKKKQPTLHDLEEKLLELPQVDCPVNHHFGGGVYVRELFIPKGTLLIGKRHRNETCNILLSGTLVLYMGQDKPVKTITGPCIFKSGPFTKKMGYARTDVVFANVHPTEEVDLEKIEEQFIISEEEYVELIENENTKLITKGGA